MAKVELKQPVVDEIKAMLEGAAGAVIVDYRGLTVEQDTQLRKQLREAGVAYKVYKNTLIKRAAEGTDFAALAPQLEGPTALAVSKEDATAPARILANFAKTAPKLELKASVVEGTYYDQAGTSWQAAWKHPITNHQPGTRTQSDRRAAGWSRRGIILLTEKGLSARQQTGAGQY